MAQDFIEGFHKIEGNSVGARQRNFNKILKNTSFAPDEKQLVLDNLKPKTYLENLFYIDVLVHLKETNRLLEIFREGNGAFVSKIMKQPWFFREAFGNVTPDTLVNEFLPLLSFSVKIKLLKNLSHMYTEEKIDEIFDYVVNRYGLFMATSFVTACSSGKITDILKNKKVKLSTHQLKNIYKKEPNLINVYLEEQKQYTKDKDSIFDNNFLTYLAQKDPVYFWELMNKHRFPNKFKFGRRTTKKVIPTKTQDIVDQPDKYIKYFRLETLVRKLNKQGHFKRVYYNLFPRKLEKLGSTYSLCNVILKYYPKNDRYNLFTKTFEDIMKEDIFNYTSCIWDNLLQLIPDLKVRETWAQLKYRESSDEEYLKLYGTQKAITMIKEKINTTSSIKSRAKLLSILAKTCAVNKDLNALEEVLKYFCFRHKNNDKMIRKEFIQTLENNFNMKEFSAAHWKYIHEIFTIQRLNKEYNWQNSRFRIRHIEYLFTNDESEEDKNYFILEYLKEQLVSAGMTLDALDEVENKDLRKTILLQALEHMDTLIRTQQMESDGYYLKSQVMGKVFLFNMKYPENAISIENENIQHFLKDILKKQDHYLSYWFKINFSKIACKLNQTDFENELLKYYLNNKTLRQFSLDKTLKWYIRHDPLVVVDNFSTIMAALPPNTCHLWTKFKPYSHLSLDDKVIKHCLHKLKHGGDDEKYQFIEPLSILGTPELYIKTMKDLNCIPISSKVVLHEAETRKVYEIQKGFLKNFKNLWHPMKYLPLLLDKFCQGDYLQGSLAPLYIAFHKIPENDLQIYFDKLVSDKAMSVKKNGLFLAMYVSDQKRVLQIFNDFQEDKNTSLQKCLCISSLRYFTRNQKQEYFEKLTSYMKFLKEYDVESLEILSTVRIPEKYKSSYIINFWELLDKLKMNPNAVGFKKLMAEVLNNIDSTCIQNLPEDFCKALINKYLGTNLAKEDEIDNIFNFVIKFLMHHKNQTNNFDYFTALLKNYKSQFWDLKAREQNKIHKFINVFLTIALEEQTDLEFVIKFSTEWGKVFTPTDTFTEYVLLNMLRFKKQACDDMESYAKSIVSFAEQINAKYGEFIFSKFVHIIVRFCVSGSKEKDIVELLINILKFKMSVLSCILVMELITFRGDTFYQDRMNPIYREVNLILREIPDPKVQICYNFYSKN